jgi:hypothetical protein
MRNSVVRSSKGWFCSFLLAADSFISTVPKDKDACTGPLPPNEFRGSAQSELSHSFTQNGKTESILTPQTKDIAMAAGRDNGVVRYAEQQSSVGKQIQVRFDHKYIWLRGTLEWAICKAGIHRTHIFPSFLIALRPLGRLSMRKFPALRGTYQAGWFNRRGANPSGLQRKDLTCAW